MNARKKRQEDTGWWLASDGKWYPPESHPSATASVDASEGGTRYAGFWLRFWAFLIDVAILAIATGIITGVLGLSGSGTFGGGDLGPRDLFEVVAFWLYVALMESSGSQATVGKMALSLRVTDISGERLTFGRASGRHFAKFVSGIIFLVGFMMAGWTSKKQALHDMMAQTLVVRS